MRNRIQLTGKAILLVVATALPALCPPASGTATSSREAGLQLFAGFFTVASATRTVSFSTTILNSVSWTDISGASLTRTVPAGTDELFQVTFSAKCQVLRASGFDAMKIRVVDNGQPMEPYDNGQIFCSSSRPATYKGTWFIPASAGVHTIKAQAQILDNTPKPPPPNLPYGFIDDVTLELVAYGLGS